MVQTHLEQQWWLSFQLAFLSTPKLAGNLQRAFGLRNESVCFICKVSVDAPGWICRAPGVDVNDSEDIQPSEEPCGSLMQWAEWDSRSACLGTVKH